MHFGALWLIFGRSDIDFDRFCDKQCAVISGWTIPDYRSELPSGRNLVAEMVDSF